MAQALTANVTITARESSSEGDRALQDKTSINAALAFLDATGALGAPKVFADNRVLNTTTENIDLSGALASGLGTAVVFTKVRLIFVRWNGLGTLTASGAGASGAAAVLGAEPVGPGGIIFKASPDAGGMAVTAASADILAITTTGAGDYDIVIAGE